MNADAYREHGDGSLCWCKPERLHTMENGDEIWFHRDEDGELPPAEIVMEAIITTAAFPDADEIVLGGHDE